jgi:hypothetical protein
MCDWRRDGRSAVAALHRCHGRFGLSSILWRYSRHLEDTRGVAVLAPGVPRLKEWAYAGVFFNMTGAVASHLSVGDGASALVTPTVFTALLVTSWALRPAARGGFTLS